MAYKMFAAIYVGSSEISMKIFQVNGRKTFRQIDSVSRILELGRDTYREGKLSRESIKMICEELEGLKHKMEEYKITEYRAYATSAVREADNMDLVLDVIEHTTGIRVQVLSSASRDWLRSIRISIRLSARTQRSSMSVLEACRFPCLIRTIWLSQRISRLVRCVFVIIWHSSGTSPEDSMRSWQTM